MSDETKAMLSNRDATYLITGASSGLGAEFAKAFAPGNRIFIHFFKSESTARSVADEVESSGGRAELFQADLSTADGCDKLFENLCKKTDKLDVLINNAGDMIRRVPADSLEWDFIQHCFALNTLSGLRLSSLCVPLLKKGDSPCIVNVTSIAIRHGNPTAVVYGACKGAVDAATRGMAKELAPGIRVNAVAPGVIETPFHERLSSPERMKMLAGNTPLERNGKPEEVARAVRLLIENEFITGETIDVNGGLFMR